MGFAQVLLCSLLLSGAAWANDDPDDPYDPPRTEMMNVWTTQGELQVGVDAPSMLPGIEGKLAVTGLSSDFNWHGIIELGVPLKIVESLNWRTLDVIAGGFWMLGGQERVGGMEKSLDKQVGIGIEVLSFEQGGKARELDPTVSVEKNGVPYQTIPSDELVRIALRGVMASFHWTTLTQEHYGSGAMSDILGITGGVGVGNFGITEPGIGSVDLNGTMINLRLDVQIFGKSDRAHCSWTHIQGDGSSAFRGTLEYVFDIAENYVIGGGVKYSSIKVKGVDLDFSKASEKGIRADLLRVFLSFGITL